MYLGYYYMWIEQYINANILCLQFLFYFPIEKLNTSSNSLKKAASSMSGNESYSNSDLLQEIDTLKVYIASRDQAIEAYQELLAPLQQALGLTFDLNVHCWGAESLIHLLEGAVLNSPSRR